MQAYEVAVDLPRGRLELIMRGFWDGATFEKFASDYTTALGTLRKHGGCKSCMVDGREFAVQSLEISQRFKELIDDMAPLCAPRTATIVPAQLNRMQAERAGESITTRIFTDRKEAEAWLSASGTGDARAA